MNFLAFAFGMVFNGLSASGMLLPKTLAQISAEWNPAIQPAGYAFSIWGLIYSLLAIFVGYQLLPDSWVTDRNDDLVYGDSGIGWLFFGNMIANGVWLFLFQQDTVWGFVISMIDIIAVFATNIIMMMRATSSSVNVVEWIGMRGGFSIYAGWVTAALILNATYMLKSLGVSDPIFGGAVTEEQITIAILWIALLIYNAEAYIDRNPLYGSVFIWVIMAIRNNVVENKPQYSAIADNATAIAIIHDVSMVALWTYLSTVSGYDIDAQWFSQAVDTGIWFK